MDDFLELLNDNEKLLFNQLINKVNTFIKKADIEEVFWNIKIINYGATIESSRGLAVLKINHIIKEGFFIKDCELEENDVDNFFINNLDFILFILNLELAKETEFFHIEFLFNKNEKETMSQFITQDSIYKLQKRYFNKEIQNTLNDKHVEI